MKLLTHFKRLIRKLLYKSCYKKKQETKDMNGHVKEYLEYFAGITKPKYAVMITGSWGSGKTHYIKHLIKEWNKNKKSLKVEDKEIKLKPIYISLFGLNKTSQINDEMRKQLFPILYSKYVQKGKNILAGITKAALRVDIDIFSEEGDNKKDGQISVTPDIMSIFENDELTIKGKKIIVFDDLERCTIPLAEVLGYINYFIEHYDCNVIIISDQEKIKSDDNNEIEDYKRIKEKIVGQTLEIQCDVESAIQEFIEEIGDKSEDSIKIRTDLYARKDLIIRVFEASQTNNLRLLRHCLKDLARFIKHIDNQYVKHNNYKEFLDNFIFLFVLVYMEFHSGNQKYFDGSELEYENIQNDNFRNTMQNIENKYITSKNIFVVKYYDSAYPSAYLCSYFKTGVLDKDILESELKQNGFFSSYTLQPWGKLWRWFNLEEKDFKKTKDEVIKKFFNDKDFGLRTIFQITGILLSLIQKQLIEQTKDDIVKRAKELINLRVKNIPKKDRYYIYKKNRFYDIEKYFDDTDNVILDKLIAHSITELRNYEKKEEETSVSNLIFSINDELDRGTFYNKLYEITGIYGEVKIPIFKYIDGEVFANHVKFLKNKTIFSFVQILNTIYPTESNDQNTIISHTQIEDIQSLKNFKAEIDNHEGITDKIKIYNLNVLSKKLEEIIDKLEKFRDENTDNLDT